MQLIISQLLCAFCIVVFDQPGGKRAVQSMEETVEGSLLRVPEGHPRMFCLSVPPTVLITPSAFLYRTGEQAV